MGPKARTPSSTHVAWHPAAVARLAWTILSVFVVLSTLVGVSALPAILFVEWNVGWELSPRWLRVIFLTMALLPAYLIFVLVLMVGSAVATRALGWRSPRNGDLRIADLEWPLCNWGRYMIVSHVVRMVAGPLFGTTPLWIWYLRLNGATVGRQVWVNSLGVTDHCLIELGDDVVIGAGVRMSAHTVERGYVRFAPVRVGAGSTIGIGTHVEIGADIGPGCQIGSLSMVPKHARLEGPATWVGVPVRRLAASVTEPAGESPPSDDDDHHLAQLSASDVDTVILVPGLDGTALLFYRQVPLLARRFNVVSFPFSDDPDASMDDLVDDLVGLIEEVSDHGAILIGESFGGALSLSTALARPDLVRGLVIVNSFPYLDQRLQLLAAPVALRILPWGLMPIVRRLTERRLHSPHCRDEDLAEFHTRSQAIDQHGYRSRLELLRHYDVRDRLAEIEQPTLLLAGDSDQLLPSVRWARFMADAMPRAEMQVLEGYGHVCLINHDLDLEAIVGPWWDSVVDAVVAAPRDTAEAAPIDTS